jgi:hypothetical protein
MVQWTFKQEIHIQRDGKYTGKILETTVATASLSWNTPNCMFDFRVQMMVQGDGHPGTLDQSAAAAAASLGRSHLLHSQWSSYDRTWFSGPDKQEILVLTAFARVLPMESPHFCFRRANHSKAVQQFAV